MLLLELRTERLGEQALAWDRGAGALAVAAIAALPPGPCRDLEVAVWTQRLAAGDGRIAFVIRPDSDRAELDALADLDAALRERFGWRRLADRVASAGGAR